MIGSYAGIVFQTSDQVINTFQGLTRTTTARFADHDVIGTKPKKEFLGPGLMSGSFSMELSSQWGIRPMDIIKKLDRYISTGRESRFILGGHNLGRFVMLSKSEEYGTVTNKGTVISCKIDVELEEYN